MKVVATVWLAALLCACSVWPAGHDPQGDVLMQNATAVLAALNHYVQVNHRVPATLRALVPRYIAALPEQPELNYSTKRSSLVFNYAPSWPTPGISACEAHFGETAFHCIDAR